MNLPESNPGGKRSVVDFAVRLREQITRYRPEYRGPLVEFQREMFGAEFRRIEFAGGINRGDLRERRRVDGGNVRRGDPTVTDDADIVFLHV